MIYVLDSSTLALLINPNSGVPKDPNTKQQLRYAPERVRHLIDRLSAKDTLVVPTPVLAEILVKAGEAGPELFEKLSPLARLSFIPFDMKAAIECAVMEQKARAEGTKKGSSEEPWQKVKFDRQIIAISRVVAADAIYTDDEKFVSFAKSVGMKTISTWELPIPNDAEDLFSDLD